MVERRENLPLVAKAPDDEAVVETGVDQFDRDAVLEFAVGAPRFINGAHAATAKLPLDPVDAHTLTNQRFLAARGRLGFQRVGYFRLLFHANKTAFTSYR